MSFRDDFRLFKIRYRFLYSALWWFVGLVTASLLVGNVGIVVWWIALLLVCYVRAVRWAVEQDRKERSQLLLGFGFIKELRDIEKRVTGSEKVSDNQPGFDISFSVYRKLPCIICGRPSNQDGKFCDIHAD